MQNDLILRDIHYTQSPSWWPPAPGWWIVVLLSILVVAVIAYVVRRKRKRYQQLVALFDSEIKAAKTPANKAAAVSELLKRAAHKKYPDAQLQNNTEWIELLKGKERNSELLGYQDLLLEGQYQPAVDAARVEKLVPLARKRFIHWMHG